MLSSQSPPCSSSSYSPSPSSPSSCSDSESSTSTTNSNSSGSDDGGGFLHVRCWKAEMLAEALVNPHVPLVLLDVRSSSSATIIGNIQYSLCAGNIPTALVKRAAFPLQRLVRDFVKEDSAHHRLLLNHLLYKKEAGCCGEEITPMHIVVYDQDTHSSIKPASLLDLIVARLDRETFTSRICVHWLNGGFDAFSSQYSSLCNLVVAKSSENGSDTTETSPAYEKGNETPPECLPFDVLSKDSYFLIKDNKVSSIPTFLRSLMENGDILEDLAMKWKIIERNEASRLSEAFHSGKSSSLFQFSVKTGIERSHLNRYRNVWPFDHNRVKITSSSSSASDNEDDYINASYINIPLYPTSSSAFPPQDPILSSTTANFKTFISTQAPLSSTTSVFWKMVFDHNTPVIIMLSNTNQDYLTQQCYWPSITDKMILPTVELVVENIEEHTLHENHQIIIRKFKISSSNLQQHTVTHIQYLDWADHFIPGNILSLFQIRDLVNKLRSNDCTAARSNDQSDYIISPLSSRSNFLAISTTAPQNAACHVVIHCSAGCGRTGVYMVIDTLLECLESQETRLIEKEPDTCTDIIFHLVELLRKQRVLTVQTFAQYVFCYEALLKFSLGC